MNKRQVNIPRSSLVGPIFPPSVHYIFRGGESCLSFLSKLYISLCLGLDQSKSFCVDTLTTASFLHNLPTDASMIFCSFFCIRSFPPPIFVPHIQWKFNCRADWQVIKLYELQQMFIGEKAVNQSKVLANGSLINTWETYCNKQLLPSVTL